MAHRSTNVKNMAASVQARLKTLASDSGQRLNDLFLLYTLQGFLRRVAQSPHREHLVLKGGLLLFGMLTDLGRATHDLDLEGMRVPVDPDSVAALVRELCEQPLPEDDGLRFDPASVQTEIIIEENEYPGVRARLYGYLGPARSRVVIDIGAGDPIVPGPCEFAYPTLLNQHPFTLQAYSVESVIAEKLHALVERGLLSTRLKDCYDLWTLAQQHTFDGALLQQAIQATFTARGRAFTPELPTILTPAFAEDAQKQAQWTAFLAAKSVSSVPITLAEALAPVTQLLAPLWQATSSGQPFSGSWDAAAAVWRDTPIEAPADHPTQELAINTTALSSEKTASSLW